jgi:hypothetical protein
MTLKNYSAAVPVISYADVAGTIRYFEKTLGFEQQFIWGDPPVYAGVKAGGALLLHNSPSGSCDTSPRTAVGA